MPAAVRKRHFDSLAQEVYLNLWRAYDRLQLIEEELFAGYDLTAQQYNVLRLLRGKHPGDLPTLALSRLLVSRAPDITRILDKLERRGLITRRRPDENRRVVRVAITSAGLALLKQLHQPVRDCHQRQLGHLSAAEQKRLVTSLKAVRKPHEPPDGDWT